MSPPPGEWAPESEHPHGLTPDEVERILGPAERSGTSPINDFAAAVRRLTDLAVGRSLSAEELVPVTRRLDEIADRLEATAAPGKAPRHFPMREGPPQDYFVTSPVIGFANPLAPPVRIWAVKDPETRQLELRGAANFGYPYEGPPTCVHGGVIAETFDELLGTTNILTGHAGMTGTLTIRYRRPTPLLTDLDLEARLTDVDGRKIRVWGGMFHEGELTAEADGLFIEAGPKRMLQIAAENARSAGDEAIDPQLEQALQIARSRPSQ